MNGCGSLPLFEQMAQNLRAKVRNLSAPKARDFYSRAQGLEILFHSLNQLQPEHFDSRKVKQELLELNREIEDFLLSPKH